MHKHLLLLICTALCSSALYCNQTEITAQISQHQTRIAHNPENAEYHFAYGDYLASLDRREYDTEAFTHLKKATELQPHTMQWLFRLGSFACRIGLLQESLEAYMHILKKHPSLTSVLYNAGFTFKVAGELDVAARIYAHIIAKDPEYEPAHLGLAFALIAHGKYAAGWKEHLWNLKKQKKDSPELRQFIQDGTLAGKRILLIPEGGLGDTLHFIRYAQRIHHMGAQVIVAVQRPLLALLSGCPYIDLLLPTGLPIEKFDAKATLMSLATFFQDTQDTIPQNIPYIFPDPNRVAYWNKQLADDHSFKIGICWQPDSHNDISRLPIARRGIPLSFFHTLATTPGVTLYSLQQHEGLDQLNNLPQNAIIKTFDSTFDVTHGSFCDTAAVMQSLDLIISTDTATAHLAGALGKRTWLLLPFNSDWRWLAHRSDSPWYPTMRIFQQERPFDWHTTMHTLHDVFFNEVYPSITHS